MKICIINKSPRVTDTEAALIADALQVQLAEHVAPAWERLPPTVFFSADGSIPDGVQAVIALLSASDAPGALGYHLEAPDGTAVARVFVDPVLDAGGGVLDGGKIGASVASVVSHECCELLIDFSINMWFDGPTIAQGSSYAAEVGDPVQRAGYTIRTPGGQEVLVSNFVLPAFFDMLAPQGTARDWMKRLTQPFSLDAGGYMIVRAAPGSEQQVLGAIEPPEWLTASKGAHEHARNVLRISRRIPVPPGGAYLTQEQLLAFIAKQS